MNKETFQQYWTFYWPLALTGVVMLLSRQFQNGALARFPDPAEELAIYALASSTFMLFNAMMIHNPLNQLRHFIVTFGRGDLKSVRQFMLMVMLGMTGIMLVVAATPFSDLIIRDWLGVHGAAGPMARQVFWIMCLIPLVVTLRNYFHGLALIYSRTRRMAVGAVFRTLAIYGFSMGFYLSGILDHRLAAVSLVMGFVMETIVVIYLTRRHTKKDKQV